MQSVKWNVTEVAWFRSVPLDADSDAHAAADAERGAAPPRPQPLHGVQQGDLRARALEDLRRHDEHGNKNASAQDQSTVQTVYRVPICLP